jgi:hypothetical protein
MQRALLFTLPGLGQLHNPDFEKLTALPMEPLDPDVARRSASEREDASQVEIPT